jgi:hypothetical protein
MLVRVCGGLEAAMGLWLAERQFARLPITDERAQRIPLGGDVPDSVGA